MKAVNIGPAQADHINIIQISDLHLQTNPGQRFFEIDTTASLDGVIKSINRLREKPDFILVTGDLVNEPEPVAYTSLREKLQRLQVPVFCLPGNHDDPDTMLAMLNHGNISTDRIIECGQWTIILLDSFLAGTHGGHLQKEELTFLHEQLKRTRDRHLLICVHHHPVSIGSPWMDEMMLDNADEFFAVVDQFPQVRAILWGHIHQEYVSVRNSVNLYACPSTCAQFKPETETSTRDDRPPAYRVMTLENSGSLNTFIHWMDA